MCRRIIAKKNGNRETILYPRQEMLIPWINIEMMVEGRCQIYLEAGSSGWMERGKGRKSPMCLAWPTARKVLFPEIRCQVTALGALLQILWVNTLLPPLCVCVLARVYSASFHLAAKMKQKTLSKLENPQLYLAFRWKKKMKNIYKRKFYFKKLISILN